MATEVPLFRPILGVKRLLAGRAAGTHPASAEVMRVRWVSLDLSVETVGDSYVHVTGINPH